MRNVYKELHCMKANARLKELEPKEKKNKTTELAISVPVCMIIIHDKRNKEAHGFNRGMNYSITNIQLFLK